MAQTNFLTLKVNLRQNLNQRNQAAYQKYYAEVDSEKTLTTLGLAKHLKDHGCLAGLDAIQAVLAKLAECIPEITSQGYGVMLDGLGKFYPTLKSKGATEAEMADEGWQLSQLIQGVRLRFLPTSKQMQNITSKQYMTRCAVEGGNLIRAVRAMSVSDNYIGIDGDMSDDRSFCLFSILKHIDQVMVDYVGMWLNGTMPKHQTLGLADGATDVVVSDYRFSTVYGSETGRAYWDKILNIDSLRQVAIKKEGERYEKK